MPATAGTGVPVEKVEIRDPVIPSGAAAKQVAAEILLALVLPQQLRDPGTYRKIGGTRHSSGSRAISEGGVRLVPTSNGYSPITTSATCECIDAGPTSNPFFHCGYPTGI